MKWEGDLAQYDFYLSGNLKIIELVINVKPSTVYSMSNGGKSRSFLDYQVAVRITVKSHD